ncbi:hypothetical protein KY284_005158 [Solanum tuberosum]|nr:hypothetical protein KY284_005158 [Solanum tuberosum]
MSLGMGNFKGFFIFIEAINNDFGVNCEFTSLMNVERIQKNRISKCPRRSDVKKLRTVFQLVKFPNLKNSKHRRDVANLGFPARSVKPLGLNGIRLEGSYIEKAIKMVPNLHSKLTLDEEAINTLFIVLHPYVTDLTIHLSLESEETGLSNVSDLVPRRSHFALYETKISNIVEKSPN